MTACKYTESHAKQSSFFNKKKNKTNYCPG